MYTAIGMLKHHLSTIQSDTYNHAFTVYWGLSIMLTLCYRPYSDILYIKSTEERKLRVPHCALATCVHNHSFGSTKCSMSCYVIVFTLTRPQSSAFYPTFQLCTLVYIMCNIIVLSVS